MIRGHSLDNPPLVMLHGGPGFSETVFFRHYNATLERAFTVVYWDQRGTGKSYSKTIPPSSMNVEQFLSDLDQLADVVRASLGSKRVILFGHSWGSVLGALYAARFPEKVSVYVGGAQIGDAQAGEARSYELAVAEARRRRNRKALAALERIGPPPYTADDVFTERTWLQRLEGQLGPKMFSTMGRMVQRSNEGSLLDLPATMRGFRFSLRAMWAEVSKLNLIEAAPALQMPVFLFLGRRDHWVPPETSMAYFDALSAPSKRVVWFEESGHEMFADEPAKFNALMEELVRPVAVASNRTRDEDTRPPAP
jgi:pimeloyl-ACP methyl ester carboxylesterase